MVEVVTAEQRYFRILIMHDELIHEQRLEIGQLKNTINKLRLKLESRKHNGST